MATEIWENGIWENRTWRAMVAGFAATIVLSMMMLIKSAAGVMPYADPIEALTKVSTMWLGTPLQPWVGWVEHFLMGTVLWGIVFAVIETALPGPGWLRGVLFSIGAWFAMMLILMPLAGAGLFGLGLGWGIPIMTLVLHMMWGAILGWVYEWSLLDHHHHPGHAATP